MSQEERGMRKAPLLEGPEQIKALARLLQNVLPVRKFDTPEEPASWNLAVGFADIYQACATISEEHIPALLASTGTSGDVDGILLEIGEELRHILYHVRDMPFYRYLDE